MKRLQRGRAIRTDEMCYCIHRCACARAALVSLYPSQSYIDIPVERWLLEGCVRARGVLVYTERGGERQRASVKARARACESLEGVVARQL